MQFLDEDIKDQECKNTIGDTLQEIFFNAFDPNFRLQKNSINKNLF